jgi:hypothetical protein
MRRMFAALAYSFLLGAPAGALIGDATTADAVIRRYTVAIYGPHRGCSGAVVAQDLVLTAGHCTKDENVFQIVGFIAGAPSRLSDVSQVALHPQNADLALLKLGKPLPTGFAPAFLTVRPVAIRDRVIVVGYGITAPGDAKSFGTARMAVLTVQARSDGAISLTDPKYQDGSGQAGGACSGDSGAPVFTLRGAPFLIGIVAAGGCTSNTGLTLATPLTPHWDWLLEAARSLGSPLAP